MSKVWITGEISREEMMEHHPLEYEEIIRERREKSEIERIKNLIQEVRKERRNKASDQDWDKDKTDSGTEDGIAETF